MADQSVEEQNVDNDVVESGKDNGIVDTVKDDGGQEVACLLYTSDAADDAPRV